MIYVVQCSWLVQPEQLERYLKQFDDSPPLCNQHAAGHLLCSSFYWTIRRKGTTRANVRGLTHARCTQATIIEPFRVLKMICRATLHSHLTRYSKQQAPSSSCQQVLFQWTGCPGMSWEYNNSHCLVAAHRERACAQKCTIASSVVGFPSAIVVIILCMFARLFNVSFKEMQTHKCLHKASSSVHDTYILWCPVRATQLETGLSESCH